MSAGFWTTLRALQRRGAAIQPEPGGGGAALQRDPRPKTTAITHRHDNALVTRSVTNAHDRKTKLNKEWSYQ